MRGREAISGLRRAGSAPRPPTSLRRGFTLIEVIVGIALLAIFIGGIYTVVVGTMQAKRRIEQSAAIFTAGPEILDLVERDLRGAYHLNVAEDRYMKAQRQTVGGEEVTILDMITTTNSKVSIEVNDEFVRSDVTEIGYRMRASEEFSDLLELYRREQLFFDDDLLKGGRYYLVYDRVVSLVMDFYEPPDDGETTSSIAEEEGKEEWDSTDAKALPHAVKITLTLAPPLEMGSTPELLEKRYVFVRWVLMSTAYDKVPRQDPPPDR